VFGEGLDLKVLFGKKGKSIRKTALPPLVSAANRELQRFAVFAAAPNFDRWPRRRRSPSRRPGKGKQKFDTTIKTTKKNLTGKDLGSMLGVVCEEFVRGSMRGVC
jgi:hypothetical protein